MDKIEKLTKMINEAEEDKAKIQDKLAKIKVDLDRKKITRAEFEKRKREHHEQLKGINSRITILKKQRLKLEKEIKDREKEKEEEEKKQRELEKEEKRLEEKEKRRKELEKKRKLEERKKKKSQEGKDKVAGKKKVNTTAHREEGKGVHSSSKVSAPQKDKKKARAGEGSLLDKLKTILKGKSRL